MAIKLQKLVLPLTLIAALSQASCGGSNATTPGVQPTTPGVIGASVNQDPPAWRFFTSGGAPVFYGYDIYAARMDVVKAGNSEVQTSAVLPVPARTDSWFAGPGGKFYFTFEDRELFVINPYDGARTSVKKSPGAIKSAAADEAQGLYAFVDEYFSVTLVSVGQDGKIAGQWTGGPVLGQGVVIAAGDILPGGTLMVVTDKNAVALIDVKASIDKSAWSFRQFDLELTGMNWVAAVAGRTSRALVTDSHGIYLVDTQGGKVLDSVLPTAKFYVQKTGKPHLRYFDEQSKSWTFVSAGEGDTLQQQQLTSPAATSSEQDFELIYLTKDYVNAVSAGTAGRSRRVLSVRFTDALVAVADDIDRASKVGFSDDAFVEFRASPLGSIQLTDLRSGSKQSFSGFNRQHLQDARR